MTIMKPYLFIIIFTFSFCSCNIDPNIKKEYYDNGKVKLIKRYKYGVIDGQAQWFFENGNIEQIVLFKDAKENGNSYYFYESGTLKSFRYWRDGKMVGYVCDYYDDTVGIIKSVLYFNDNGQLIYRKNFDPSGNFVNEEGKKPIYNGRR